MMNINFDKYDKELLELSFKAKSEYDIDKIMKTIRELEEIRNEYIDFYGIDSDLLRLQEIITNYTINYKEAKKQDITEEKKRLKFLLSLNYEEDCQ